MSGPDNFRAALRLAESAQRMSVSLTGRTTSAAQADIDLRIIDQTIALGTLHALLALVASNAQTVGGDWTEVLG